MGLVVVVCKQQPVVFSAVYSIISVMKHNGEHRHEKCFHARTSSSTIICIFLSVSIGTTYSIGVSRASRAAAYTSADALINVAGANKESHPEE